MADDLFGDLFAGDEDFEDSGAGAASLRRTYNIPRPSDPRPPHCFAGLLNQGTTCYLNSLIQALYMTPEFRSEIYALTPEMLSVVVESNTTPTSSDLPATEPPKSAVENANAEEGEHVVAQPAEITNPAADALLGMGFDARRVALALSMYPEDPMGRGLEWLLSGVGENQAEETMTNTTSSETPVTAHSPATSVPTKATPAESAPVNAFADDDDNISFDLMPLIGDFEEDTSTTKPLPPPPKPTLIRPPPPSYYAPQLTSSTSSSSQTASEKSSTNSQPSSQSSHAAVRGPSPSPSAPGSKRVKERVIPQELQKLFAYMQAADQNAVSTEGLTRSFGWNGRETYVQHDVHELNRVLFDAIERSLRGSPNGAGELLARLYRGVMVSQVVCGTCQKVSEHEEAFYDVPLILGQSRSVLQSLEAVVAMETLAGDNRYYCEQCGRKVDTAYKGAVFRTLPPVLIFSLVRFEYDFENDRRVKNTNHFPFPLLIDMWPFTEQFRRVVTAQSAADLSAAGVLDAYRVLFSEKLTPITLQQRVSENSENAPVIEQPAVDLTSTELFELFGVVIHRGRDAGFGHYHAYLRDVSGEGRGDDVSGPPTVESDWWDFDDATVTPIPMTRIASQYGGKAECAYMLIYRRRPPVSVVSTAVPVPPPPSPTVAVPRIPPHLEDIVRQYNRELNEQRREYDFKIHQLELTVYAPRHFEIDQSCGSVREVGAKSAATVDDGDSEVQPSYRKIAVDGRTPLEDLKTRLVEEFGSDIPPKEQLQLAEITVRCRRLFFVSTADISAPSIDNHETVPTAIDKLRPHMQLLAWNGRTFGNGEYVPSADRLRLVVQFWQRSDADAAEEHVVDIAATATVGDLRSTLAAIGNEANQKAIFIGRVDGKKIEPISNDALSLVAVDMHIEGARIVAERMAPESTPQSDTTAFVPVAQRKLEARENMIELFIADHCSPKFRAASGPPSAALRASGSTTSDKLATVVLLIDKNATIGELKLRAVSAVDTKLPAEYAVLRRTQPGGYPGAELSDDARTLRSAGIEDQMRLILEFDESEWAAGMAKANKLQIRFVAVNLAGKKLIGGDAAGGDPPLEVEVDRTWTISQTKAALAARVPVSTPGTAGPALSWRLYRTHPVWGERAELFDDEQITLFAAGVAAGDMLWLQEGNAPVKGAISLSVQLYSLKDDATLKAIAATTAGISSTAAAQRTLISPAVHLVAAVDGSGAASGDDDVFRVVPLFDIDVAQEATVNELKELLLAQPMLSHVPGSHFLRLWCGGRLLRDGPHSLKKLHLKSDTKIAVQVLNAEEQLDAAGTELLLFVHKRNSQTRLFEVPPAELCIRGDASVAELKEKLAAVFGIPVEAQIVAKYNHFNGSWRVLGIDPSRATTVAENEHDRKETTTVTEGDNAAAKQASTNTDQSAQQITGTKPAGGRKTRQRGAKQRGSEQGKTQATALTGLRGKPWQLRDGDIIVIKDASEDPENKDDFTRVTVQPRTKALGSKKGEGGSSKGQRAREVALTIYVDDY